MKKQHDRRADTGEFFNVFLIDGVKIDEDTHSAILADLLNPNGSHRQGTVFLKYFLNLEPLGLADSFDYGELEDFHVKRKANSKYGEIDILLEKKDDACIIIENKIHDAKDQDNQLNRYYKYAKENFTDDQIKLIYLTLDGKPPSEDSLRGEDGQKPLDVGRVICMSYESHIVKWLEECIKKVAEIDPIREVLLQYQGLIKKLTGQPINKELTMEISEILTREQNLIPELENSILEAKVRLQCKFWEELRKKINEDCNIEFSKVSKDEVRRFFSKNSYLGIEYKITSCLKLPLTSTFDIAFRVELDASMKYRDKVYYGFVLLENGSRFKKCRDGQFDKYADLAGEALRQGNRHDCWLLRKDMGYQNQDSSFGYIAEDAELEKLVEIIAQEIKDAVDKFIEAKQDAGL